MSSTRRGKFVDDRDGGLVLAKGRVLQISLIDGREQQRRVGKELLSIFAREYRRGTRNSHDEVRRGMIGVVGTDEGDERLFRWADGPCPTHDDLNDIQWPAGTPVGRAPEFRPTPVRAPAIPPALRIAIETRDTAVALVVCRR